MLAGLAGLGLLLTACGPTAGSSRGTAGDGVVDVVASTSVYGDIVSSIGGDKVRVSSIISRTSQDPHSYEATTPAEFEKAVSRTGFSRFPMLDDDGMLSGYLHIKDVLSIPDAGYHQPIAESRIRSLANLAMDDEIEKAMSVMQRTGSHLARVIGPDGLTQGVLFLEDVIEQLVGEIRDATQATGYRRLGQDQ
jgi:CBS domain containing-hemolysin-like protein